ncbi:right-handed parallel beta-helix repeat-containing protein [Neobacillus cucumis]|nr:right-handed parallel beta-helix repeat-containing protein [Neobacillus cucumis]
MQRRNFLINFILWILSFVFGYKIGNQDHSQTNIIRDENGTLSNSFNFKVLNEKIDDIAINVKEFGAKSDGTDSTQAFIDARKKSKIIFVPYGTFIVDNLSLQDVVLVGNGTLKWKGASTSFMLELKGRCIIEGLTFDGNGPVQMENHKPAIKLTRANKTTICQNAFTNFKGKVIVSDLADSPNIQVFNNRFENCGTVKGCDVLTVRSSNWLINGNFFSNIGDGHCIRLGLYNYDSKKNKVEQVTVSDNQFKNTQHVGVTCELNTCNVLIIGNIFDELDQAIKCESAGNTVSEITVSQNIIRNIKLETALHLSVEKVKFTNNRCYNLANGPYFGEYFDCSHNDFYDCGSSSGEVIGVFGKPKHGIVSNNIIVNPKYRGIVVSGGMVTGNQIVNCPDQAIRVSDSSIIVNNIINGSSEGIYVVSTASNTVIKDNVLLNILGTPISNSNKTSHQKVIIKENLGTD